MGFDRPPAGQWQIPIIQRQFLTEQAANHRQAILNRQIPRGAGELNLNTHIRFFRCSLNNRLGNGRAWTFHVIRRQAHRPGSHERIGMIERRQNRRFVESAHAIQRPQMVQGILRRRNAFYAQ